MLGFCEDEGCGFDLRGSRGAGGAFYRPEQGPLACALRRGVRPDCRVRARPGVGESPDGRAPRVGERGRKEGAERAGPEGKQKRAGGGEFGPREGKGWGWAGWAESEVRKKKGFPFF